MTPRQKLLFTQIQLALAGVLIMAFGFVWDRTELIVLGAVVCAYGAIRARILPRMIEEDVTPDESLDEIIARAKEDEKAKETEKGSKAEEAQKDGDLKPEDPADPAELTSQKEKCDRMRAETDKTE